MLAEVSISSLHLLNQVMVKAVVLLPFAFPTLAEARRFGQAMADAADLERLCFVDGKPLRANAAQRELLSLYAQAKKI